jgi:hypothetical protein
LGGDLVDRHVDRAGLVHRVAEVGDVVDDHVGARRPQVADVVGELEDAGDAGGVGEFRARGEVVDDLEHGAPLVCAARALLDQVDGRRVPAGIARPRQVARCYVVGRVGADRDVEGIREDAHLHTGSVEREAGAQVISAQLSIALGRRVPGRARNARLEVVAEGRWTDRAAHLRRQRLEHARDARHVGDRAQVARGDGRGDDLVAPAHVLDARARRLECGRGLSGAALEPDLDDQVAVRARDAHRATRRKVDGVRLVRAGRVPELLRGELRQPRGELRVARVNGRSGLRRAGQQEAGGCRGAGSAAESGA